MKTLILYYSYGGNTKRIAEMIQREIGGDIARMDTVVPYDGDYDEVVNQGQREIAEGYCPELKPLHIWLERLRHHHPGFSCLVVHLCARHAQFPGAG